MKILIVDDTEEIRDVLRLFIEKLGHEIIEAVDGQDGFEKTKIHKPDLIITDAMMPNVDGFTLLRNIKKDSNLSSIPCVFYSAIYTGSRDRDLALSLGAEAFIEKPEKPEEFWKMIQTILERKKQPAAQIEKRMIDDEIQFLKSHDQTVVAKLEEKVKELEKAIAENKQYEKTLRENKDSLQKSETMFKALFESNPDGIIIVNREGHIVQINKQGAAMFGYTRDELLNQTIDILVPERFRERHVKHRNGYFAEPRIRAMGECFGLSSRRKDGSDFSVDIMLSPLYTDEEMCVICVVRNVTERVQREKEIRERALQQEAVASLSQRGLEGIDLLSLMNETVTLVARILDVEYSKILDLLPDGKSLFLRAGVGWKHGLVGHAIIDAGVHSQAGYTLLSQEPVVVEDLRTEKRFNGPPLLLDHGVVSGMSVIIHGHNKPYGVFGAHTTQRRTFSKDDIHFLKSVANMIGMAIERDRAEKILKNSEASLTNAQRIAHLGNWEWNIVTNEIRWSDEVYRIFGLTPQEFGVTYGAFLNSVYPDDREFVKQSVNKALYDKVPYSIDHRIVLPDGSERIVHEQAEVVFDSTGKAIQMNGTVQDVTERKRAEEEIKRLFTAIDQSINVVFITDVKGQIGYVNSTFEQVTGYAKEEVIGQNPRMLASGETIHAEYEELWNTILAGKTWRGIFKNKKKNGQYYWGNGLITPIRNEKEQITHFLAIQEDITEKMQSEERIKYLASYDELTGLCNRTCFMEQLNERLSHNKDYNQTGVLLLMDIDGFRLINDTYGHSTGDTALRHMAEFLITTLFEIDKHYVNKDIRESILGRLGGDEFAIFLPDRNEKEGIATAEEIRKKLEKSRFVEIPSHLTASIGVALYPRDGRTTKELLIRADASIYHAKGLGYNRIHLYNTEDLVLEKTHSRMKWKGRIQKAIEEDRFEPWFQPILDLKDNQIHHCEALARIRDTNGEIILPGAFVDTAETMGLITTIDRIIIKKTLKTQSNLCKQGKVLSFSVNLSGKDLDDKEFLQFLKSMIIETGADPKHLIFEITETAAIRDLDRAIKFIRELKAIGCSFALDDFGVGFTSFKYLREMEVDYIKIDGSFIRTLYETTNDHIFVKAIADVARGMGIKTIAEFVENNEIIKILKEYGVDYGQGYFIGKPSPAV